MANGMIIVLSGPSGVGKGTIYNEVLARMPNTQKSVSVTTRAPRVGEVDGVHYYFKTLEQYQQMIAAGEFLETAEVYCNYYGTPKAHVLDVLAKGDNVIFEIDILGAKQIKRTYPDAILIFISPPSLSELRRRLVDRGTDSPESIERRVSSTVRELKECNVYDYIVVNDDLENAISQTIGIINSERCRVKRNFKKIKDLIGGN